MHRCRVSDSVRNPVLAEPDPGTRIIGAPGPRRRRRVRLWPSTPTARVRPRRRAVRRVAVTVTTWSTTAQARRSAPLRRTTARAATQPDLPSWAADAPASAPRSAADSTLRWSATAPASTETRTAAAIRTPMRTTASTVALPRSTPRRDRRLIAAPRRRRPRPSPGPQAGTRAARPGPERPTGRGRGPRRLRLRTVIVAPSGATRRPRATALAALSSRAADLATSRAASTTRTWVAPRDTSQASASATATSSGRTITVSAVTVPRCPCVRRPGPLRATAGQTVGPTVGATVGTHVSPCAPSAVRCRTVRARRPW